MFTADAAADAVNVVCLLQCRCNIRIGSRRLAQARRRRLGRACPGSGRTQGRTSLHRTRWLEGWFACLIPLPRSDALV